jgi:hypothetical protein
VFLPHEVSVFFCDILTKYRDERACRPLSDTHAHIGNENAAARVANAYVRPWQGEETTRPNRNRRQELLPGEEDLLFAQPKKNMNKGKMLSGICSRLFSLCAVRK